MAVAVSFSDQSLRYELGPFRLDTNRRRILKHGRAVSWRSRRHFELLLVLIDAEPEVVPYDELRQKVWNGKEIDPQTISQTVENLRVRLGNYADCIRNQPGQGYYFDRPPSGKLDDGDLPLEMLTLRKVANDEWTRRTGHRCYAALDFSDA